VLTVKRDKSTFHFVIRESLRRGKERPAQPPAGYVQKQLWFGGDRLAETFLRGFVDDGVAIAGLTGLLPELGGERKYDVLPGDCVQQLAPHLVSGQLLVMEVVAGSSGTAGGAKPESKTATPPPFPLRADAPPPPAAASRGEAPDTPTFSSNVNEAAQVQTLVAGAESGAFLCEVCNKA
jgi:hypothetical protein